MSNLCWLTDAQVARLEPFSEVYGRQSVYDCCALNGFIYFHRNGLRKRGAFAPPSPSFGYKF